MLLRIGGGCSEPELEQYAERNAALWDPNVRDASKKIEHYQELREDWHKFRDHFVAVFEAQNVAAALIAPSSADEARRTTKVVQTAVMPMSKVVATIMSLTKDFGEEVEEKQPAVASTEDSDEDTDQSDSIAGGFKTGAASIETIQSVLKNAPTLTNEDIAALHKGIKHYNPEIDPHEVLYQWITGFHPLPACSYAPEPCSRICMDDSNFCEEHSCKFALDGDKACLDSVVRKRLYCKRHLCSSEKCKDCRVHETQEYCADHACFVCLELGEVAGIAADEPPRNSCERHPLCWGLGGMCPELAEANMSYCKNHAEELYCKWVSQGDVKCTDVATTGQFCEKHHVAAQALEARTSGGGSGKCQALTKKGRPCRGTPLTGRNYCRDHVHLSSQPEEPKLSLPEHDVAALEESKFDEERQTPEDAASDETKQDSVNEEGIDAESSLGESFALSEEKARADPDGDAMEATSDGSQEEAKEEKTDEFGMWETESSGEVDVDAMRYDNEDEVEESEHLQHLRDVYEVNDDSEELLDTVEEEDDMDESPWMASNGELVPLSQWNWDMALEARWSAILSVLDLWGGLNTRVLQVFTKAIEEGKRELHREMLRANARVYEGKAVIGGTITGCVARLEAIRTTNPFAILVEEASEVMEPLLVSCFSSSTRKLEMVGDHMQLQPSVMGKIDFERVNKINISMFERLIRAPRGNEVPSSVLSIQRRMRKSICGLTRNFYNDITIIEDHEVCSSKTIGDAKHKGKGKPPLLSACEGEGREVPGVQPHIFFWTHAGVQERASVGMSRVNHIESDMCCRLVQYLVHCGVPPKSIAVLTPYKGQLMLMRKKLMAIKGLVTSTGGRDPRPVPACFLSTVDRFQGDEADIVIISLVIDGKSRTPFVKLQNRMIVLLSRARLGMYIVGNKDYFDATETTHWQKTLGLLEREAESDNPEDTVCTLYKGACIGPALPICCPEHRKSTGLAKKDRDLKLGFCTVVCSVELPCSHECGLNCHWPDVAKHNKQCSVEVESPCSQHPRILKCCAVTASTGKASIEAALKKYQCDFRVEVSLPCGHSRKMKCHTHSEILASQALWPVCTEEAITPFMYPECKHILKCSCEEFDRYSSGHAPQCSEKVDYTPACGHTVSLQCHDRQDYSNQARQFLCKEKVRVALPRCGHETQIECPNALILEQWNGTPCLTFGLVKESESYGPKDYFCKRMVKFERRCGHQVTVKCERAFELAQSPSRCLEAVVITNPECGHECATTCFEADRIKDKVAQSVSLFDADEIDPVQVVREEDASNYRSYGLNVQCAQEVVYKRSCGHTTRMTCSEARHSTTQCEELVGVNLPSCGHAVRLPCHLNQQLSKWNPWQAQGPTAAQLQSIQLLHSENVVEDRLPLPGARPSTLKAKLNDCQASVRFRRVSSCGHDFEVKCCTAFKLLEDASAVNPCAVRIPRQLNCGHEVMMECSKDPESVSCKQSVEKRCWNFASCGNKVEVPCNTASNTIHCGKESEWLCPAGHSFRLRLCDRGYPTDCPDCSTNQLDEAIQATQKVLNDKKLAHWSQESARILPEMDGVTHISMSEHSKRDFHIRKMKLLARFKGGLDLSAKWASALFTPQEFACFAVLSKKLQKLEMDSFEMRDFGSLQTLNGIEVYEATQENLARVVGTTKACVVFGCVYTAKHLTNPVDIPNGQGKKRAANLQKWVARQSSHGYDGLYRDAKSGKKGGSWIMWHPHVMFPVHRVELTDSNREAVLQCLPEKSLLKQASLSIRFEKPEGVANQEEEKRPAVSLPSSVVPAVELDKLRHLVGSVIPLYETLTLWYPWDGKTLSTGASRALSKSIEKTLACKLNFVSSDALGFGVQTQKTPFGGVKYLTMLSTQGKLEEDGNLFVALEMLAVRKQDVVEARAKLEEYATRTCGEEGGYAHPLVILAIARLASRLSQTSGVHRKLVELFAGLYPEAKDIWLSETEAELVKTIGGRFSGTGSMATSGAAALSVEDKWDQLKSESGCRSEAMEDLLKLVGLRKVKQSAYLLFKNAIALQKMSATQRKKNMMAFNYCFVGNPGTGKTTVARLFASILRDSKIRRTNTFVECTAQKLKDDGADEFREKLKAAMGGVLFIDEAYELDPLGDFKGKPIVAELLTAAEDKRDDLSIILAGYEDDIQKKLYAYNDGLSSRFIEITFEDFDAQDLEVVWDGLAKDRGWKYERAIAAVACRRLAKAAGRKGFGNARAVRKLFEHAVKEAMAREDFDGTLTFQTVDLLGDRPSTNPKLKVVLKEIHEKTGWKKIKAEIHKLVRISDENYERELKGQETVPLCLNRLFLGNPGTGKTTCAAYYGRVLKALNFLSNGEVVKKTAGDFVGSHVGESQTKTSQILEMAKGKVLVIDEAYNLNDNMYGKQVLDVLVEKVQGTESDDIAVLLIGYENEMLEMLRTQNPGLMRRFPPQYAFQFEDYTEHELLEILEWNCTKRSVTCSYDVAEALLKQLALQKTQPNFGNAGAVEQLLKHALGKAMSRPMVGGMTVLTLADVDVEETQSKDPLQLLDRLYRMDEIKLQLSSLRNEMAVAEREGSTLPKIGHFVFRGSPGTGKTTVARVMAQILHDMGVLATKKLVETSGLELTGEHVGQTKKKVEEKLGEAKGGLLFIDEAYELGKGIYGEEAMTTLVAAMTDPSYLGMVIIIAGYSKDIDQMLDLNAGLKSRFTRFVDFLDWEAQDAVMFLSAKAEAENFELESEAVLSLQQTFGALKELSKFGNGRDAIHVWEELTRCRAQRVVNEPESERTITKSDAENAGEAILVARRGSGKRTAATDEDPLEMLDGLYRMEKIREQLSRLRNEMAVAEREGSARPEIGHFVFRGSPGTGKTTVARVMARILHAMGGLATTKLVETSGLDLTGEYLGQTKKKVTDKLGEAKGGLLFIDEAYELGKGMYGEEAMTTLVAAMTDPSYLGMVIVIAGYPKDMDLMLNRNAGLKSRFTRFVNFPDWEAEDAVAFLREKAEKETMALQPEAEQVLQRTFVELKRLDGFGNGRDAVRVWKELLQCRAQRVVDSFEAERTITKEDAAMAGESILEARRPPEGHALSQSSVSSHPMAMPQDQSQKYEQLTETAQTEAEKFEELMSQEEEEQQEENVVTAIMEEIEEKDELDEAEAVDKTPRDPGVSDEDWEELERAKEAHAAHLDALRRARDQAKLDEERRRAEALQEKIRRICPCPAGFNWFKSSGGWRCGGGSHFVSDAQLNSQFTV
ncbi:hypothetical protein BBJ28_00018439 [Nothophytophthora sp. Chile5]|nr:hypothetical protein BBJ28_00018439 [Nothophytophthora sp. Chile5]